MKHLPAALCLASLLTLLGMMWAHAQQTDAAADRFLGEGAHGCYVEAD